MYSDMRGSLFADKQQNIKDFSFHSPSTKYVKIKGHPLISLIKNNDCSNWEDYCKLEIIMIVKVKKIIDLKDQ